MELILAMSGSAVKATFSIIVAVLECDYGSHSKANVRVTPGLPADYLYGLHTNTRVVPVLLPEWLCGLEY